MSRQPMNAEFFSSAPRYALEIDGHRALEIYAEHPEQAVEFVQLAASIFNEKWLERKKEEAKGPPIPLFKTDAEKAENAHPQATDAQPHT